MIAIAAVLLVAALIGCVWTARREGQRVRDREIERGLATMRWLGDRGEGDVLAGRWDR